MELAGAVARAIAALAGLVFWGFVLYIMVSACGGSSDDDASASSTTKTTASRAPHPSDVISGDGTHNIGGIDGKDWGMWQSSGSTRPCSWSIVYVHPYAPGQTLREGDEPAGQSTMVNIQPPGDVSAISGTIDGGRVVFQTNGCGSWKRVR